MKDVRRGRRERDAGKPPDFRRGKAHWAHHRPSGLFVGRGMEAGVRECGTVDGRESEGAGEKGEERGR